MPSGSPIIAAGVVNRRLLVSPLMIPRLPLSLSITFSSPLLVSLVLSEGCSFCGRRLYYYSYRAPCVDLLARMVPIPGGVLGISSDGNDRRIFLGLKFSIPGFLGVRKYGLGSLI